VREIYDTLTKFEVMIKDTELYDLNNLNNAFDDFTSMLYECDRALEKNKVTMKRDLDNQIDTHAEGMVEMLAISQKELPFSKKFDIDTAKKVSLLYI
jgi:hypothetical protein